MTKLQKKIIPVCVIIPTYKSHKTLPRAIESILAQSSLPKEIIFIDDFSNDGNRTIKLLANYKRKIKNIKIRIRKNKENYGPAYSRNIGWKDATQKYIAFLDADDAWHQDKLSIQYNYMKDNPKIDFTAHKSIKFNPVKALTLDKSNPIIRNIGKTLLMSNFIPTRTVMLKRNIPLRFDKSLKRGEDYLLWLEIILSGYKAQFINLSLSYYFMNNFGYINLSNNITKLYSGVRLVYKKLAQEHKISSYSLPFYNTLCFLKYTRNLLQTKYQKLFNKKYEFLREKPLICFVTTIEFTISAFLLNHLLNLSKNYELLIITNTTNINFLSRNGIQARVEPIKFYRKINILSDFFSFIRLLLILLKFKPVSIHSVSPKAGIHSMLSGFLLRIPVRIHTFTGQVWVNKSGIYRFLLKFIDKAIGCMANICIIDSPSQRNYLIRNKIIKENKAIVFGSGSISGVNLKKFKFNEKNRISGRHKLDISLNSKVFVYLGRLNREKGIYDLIAAFCNVRDDNKVLLLIGPDESNIEGSIKKYPKKTLNKIIFSGYTDDPSSLLCTADVICLPSYREGFGSVLIEAAAMGIPSIASDIYGITDAVVDNKTGLLHRPGSPDEIKALMEVAIKNPRYMNKLSFFAKERAEQVFDSRRIERHWINFYASILDSYV
jgi:glycosyltransferase involved in cell wall biosynthesis